jgi:hypothetical protein
VAATSECSEGLFTGPARAYAWPWYLAAVACFATADRLAGWPSLIPVTLGLGFGVYGLTSYAHGRDGLSKHRQ